MDVYQALIYMICVYLCCIDRDGNPNVTPKVTFEVSITQRMQAAKLFLSDIDKLYSQLAVCKGYSPAMLGLAREIRYSSDRRELYRRVIGHLQQRLLATIRWCEAQLNQGPNLNHKLGSIVALTQSHVADNIPDNLPANIEENPADYEPILKPSSQPMLDSDELLKPLMIMHESLTSGGYEEIADGFLVDIIRRVAVFGLTLCPLDIRQESTRHASALDAITRYLGIGSYAQWDETSKINWLQAEISGEL